MAITFTKAEAIQEVLKEKSVSVAWADAICAAIGEDARAYYDADAPSVDLKFLRKEIIDRLILENIDSLKQLLS